jgi:hypothetical protein
MKALGLRWIAACGCLFSANLAVAATLSVGNGQTYATIAAAMAKVKPGDVVEVQGNQTYAGTVTFGPESGGQVGLPVTVRGVAVSGRLPVLSGIGPGQWNVMVVLLNANHFVFENFEIVGDTNVDHQCVVHKANDVTVRGVVVHGCAGQGLMGTDFDSGSLTLEYSEFYQNGNSMYGHQIYMATDETVYPGSVFRMQYCYVHDGAGGNNVKSRAERNEIYFNWIEAALYHELDLIGPDGQDAALAREDSDVVGNVFIKTSEWRIARIGGDGTGNTAGRYRFVNNTMVLSSSSSIAIGLQETVETLEMYNNVIYGQAGKQYQVYNHSEPSGASPVFSGANNWVLTGMKSVPPTWTGTIIGTSPGWVNASAYDYHPVDGSALIDAGTSNTAASGTQAFPRPLLLPDHMPPMRQLSAAAEPRPVSGAIDIGAFEWGVGTGGAGGAPGAGGTSGGGQGGTSASRGTVSTGGPSGSRATGGTAYAGAPGTSGIEAGDHSGCGCRLTGARTHDPDWWPAVLVAALVAMLGRRRPRRAA